MEKGIGLGNGNPFEEEKVLRKKSVSEIALTLLAIMALKFSWK